MKTRCTCPARRRKCGSAAIVVMALLSIVLIYVAGNVRTLHFLTQEVRLVEQRQLRRLATIRIRRMPVEVPAVQTAPAGQP
jgi:hypothetical protein